jgi:hypothetical protein
MATVANNVLLREARGTFGKQVVFRQRNGKTVMCNMPRPYPPKTAKQLANQERFARANAFAKAVIADPVRKAEYQARATKPGVSAYHVAFQEAFYGAEIKEVHVEEKAVTVRMRYNNGVKEVWVDDKPAVFNQRLQVWEYVLSGGEREVRAFDKMGRCWVRNILT